MASASPAAGSTAAPSASAASASGANELTVEQLWARLFTTHGLVRCLSPAEVRRCRIISRAWRRLAHDTVTPEELWHKDLDPARRREAWREVLLGGISLQAKTPQDNYEQLRERACSYDSAIRRDLNRTLPQEELFKEKNGHGQSMLFRLLRALAIRLCDIGYCQSLNFIVATLIGVFPEDEASVFHCSLALLLRHSLVDLYRTTFTKLGVVIWQFDKVVEAFLPKVHAELEKHGVNAEYYAIPWFLTLFASELPQPIIRRIWDRFLVAGWQVVVQVGLALLYSIQDELPELDDCQAMTFLRRFPRTKSYEAEELLKLAATFRVSHRMLSALEAAYAWEGEVQLFVAKDLNSGQVHWQVQAVPTAPILANHQRPGVDDEEQPSSVPRAFSRRTASPTSGASGPGAAATEGPERVGEQPAGNVVEFLLHNLDTGETTVMERAWTKYQHEAHRKAVAKAEIVKPPPTVNMTPQPPPPVRVPNGGAHGGTPGGGSFWMQSVQRQASQRLSQPKASQRIHHGHR